MLNAFCLSQWDYISLERVSAFLANGARQVGGFDLDRDALASSCFANFPHDYKILVRIERFQACNLLARFCERHFRNDGSACRIAAGGFTPEDRKFRSHFV